MRTRIFYRKLRRYKYQLIEADYSMKTAIKPPADILIENYIELTTEGELTIMRTYAWDGPSGPTIDTKNFMRPSLVHDAFYQLIREGKFAESEKEVRRKEADILLREMCLADGMSSFRAWYVYAAVRMFGKLAVKPTTKYDKTYQAP